MASCSRRLGAVALLAGAALAAAGCGGGGGDDGGRAATADRPRLTPAVARALDDALRTKVADAGIPGASASVVFPDGRQWRGAAGAAVLEPRRAMTPDTALPFDSVTKVLTAALALRLDELGRLSIQDPIRRWWPAWNGDRTATLEDLLRHTSGMRDPPPAFFERLDRGRVPIGPATLVRGAQRPLPRTGGSEYSNAGFALLGLIERRAGGRPVDELARELLFDHPGGSGLALQPAERPRRPFAHSYWYPDGLGDPVDVYDGSGLLPARSPATVVASAGALAGDVPSLARWAHELLNGRILARASLRRMTRFRGGIAFGGYGLGLAREETPGRRTMWGHLGDGWGSHTELWHLPGERLTVAVTWNDDVLDRESGILWALLDAALRTDRA